MRYIRLFCYIIVILLLIVTMFLIPPFIKVFYCHYIEWLNENYDITLYIKDDNYYFTIISALMNTFVVGLLSFKTYSLEKKINDNNKKIIKKTIYEKIENNIMQIINYKTNSIPMQLKEIENEEKIFLNILETNSKDKNNILELVDSMMKINIKYSDDPETVKRLSKQFVNKFCTDDNKIKTTYIESINKILK